jgi:hypothetical protein
VYKTARWLLGKEVTLRLSKTTCLVLFELLAKSPEKCEVSGALQVQTYDEAEHLALVKLEGALEET